MDEKKQKEIGGIFRSAAPFILGLVLALVFGWWVFPELLFSQKTQPVAFKHSTHTAVAECADCHYLRADGSFSGIPTNESCATCHSAAMGSSQAELDYIENYLERGEEVPWLVYQKQPDNVFFSHAAHSPESCQTCHPDMSVQDICSTCHPSVEQLDEGLVYKENKLTGYSQSTMKMWQCERCHANPGHLENTTANNACYTCHK